MGNYLARLDTPLRTAKNRPLSNAAMPVGARNEIEHMKGHHMGLQNLVGENNCFLNVTIQV